MRQSQDAPDHLGRGEAETVSVKLLYIVHSLGLQGFLAGGTGKQRFRISVALGLRSPKIEEFFIEESPELASGFHDPILKTLARRRCRGMAILTEVSQQQIAENGADIETHRADEGEFGVDHA